MFPVAVHANALQCPNVEARTCRNCGSKDHIAKECDQPRNPDMVKCRNCEKLGHFSRDCPEPKDWSKVQCQNCQEFGHTIKVSKGQNFVEAIMLTSRSAAPLLLPKTTPWVEAVLSRLPVAGAEIMMLLLPLLEAKLPGTVVMAAADGKTLRNAPYQLSTRTFYPNHRSDYESRNVLVKNATR